MNHTPSIPTTGWNRARIRFAAPLSASIRPPAFSVRRVLQWLRSVLQSRILAGLKAGSVSRRNSTFAAQKNGNQVQRRPAGLSGNAGHCAAFPQLQSGIQAQPLAGGRLKSNGLPLLQLTPRDLAACRSEHKITRSPGVLL